MNVEDIKLKSLCGKPIIVGNIKITPKKLSEIVEVGYDKYNKYLSLFCINDEIISEFKSQLETKSVHGHTGYLEYLIYLYIKSGDFDGTLRDDILESLSFFTNEDIKFNKIGFYYTTIVRTPEIIKDKEIYIENKEYHFLNSVDFDYIVKIIKIQNCLLSPEEEEELKVADGLAKELLEKMKKARERLKKTKEDIDEIREPLNLYDLASIVASNCNGLNIINVWDLNFLQFNDQLNRMKMLEDYEVNIRSILAGANPEEINLVHWMSKISNN